MVIEPDKTWLAEKIKICQQGDLKERQKAWQELAEQLLPHLIRMARSELRRYGQMRHDPRVQDLAAEIFLALFKQVNMLKRPESVMAWLQVAARHKAINICRTGFYAHEQAIAEFRVLDESYHDKPTPLTEIEQLRQAILALPEQCRRLVFSLYWQGLPTSEIALAEGVGQSAIGYRHRKVLRQLREYLTAQGLASYTQTDISD